MGCKVLVTWEATGLSGVTHPGFQPVTVEPKLVSFLLNLLKLVLQLLDLLLGCKKRHKLCLKNCKGQEPRIGNYGVLKADETGDRMQRSRKLLPHTSAQILEKLSLEAACRLGQHLKGDLLDQRGVA